MAPKKNQKKKLARCILAEPNVEKRRQLARGLCTELKEELHKMSLSICRDRNFVGDYEFGRMSIE